MKLKLIDATDLQIVNTETGNKHVVWADDPIGDGWRDTMQDMVERYNQHDTLAARLDEAEAMVGELYGGLTEVIVGFNTMPGKFDRTIAEINKLLAKARALVPEVPE